MNKNHLDRIKDSVARFDDQVLKKNTAIAKARQHSQGMLQKIRGLCALQVGQWTKLQIESIAIAGSYGRLEANEHSDLDFIPVRRVMKGADSLELDATIKENLRALCTKANISSPNPNGIFARSVPARKQIADFSGSHEESVADFGRRLLLLMESTCVFGDNDYSKLKLEILRKYGEDVQSDPRKNFVYLLNDTIRYFRTICVNYQWTKEKNEYGKWPIRNVKLRHSRVIMYFSMVAAIGHLSKYCEGDKVDVIFALLNLDPLLRLFVIYDLEGDQGYFRLAQFYDTFLRKMSEKSSRSDLANIEYPNRYESDVFASLKANSDGLSAELWRFLTGRMAHWEQRFFEYLIL
jgi:predicted nucleotidyltransferase